ncbi:MAG: Flp pilus assembly complex ATPase component TadA [Planctomycetes bacterium]|nr:Flp pilus assembly complex ATPase component TadA [Planctomycetota bacterium]
MIDPILMLVEYGGYLSIVKLCAFLLFFPSWALINWTYKDARSIDANEVMWTAIMLGTLVVTVLLWFLVPIYTVGLVLYLVGMLGTGVAYVKYRNARVLDFDKVLTVQHIKAVLTQSDQEDEGQENFTFITANKNEVPRPEPRTPDFFGYRAAYDILMEALKQRAESITFVPGPETFKATYQVDGASVPQADQPKEQMEYFVRFLKQVGGLNEKERRKPQKGLFKTRQGKETIEWQIRTAGSTAGEQIRIEKATKDQIVRLGELGLTPKQTEMWDGLRECRGGVYIISGPKASGLTSSLYSLLRNHDAYINSIHTLEKEITGQLPSVTQEHYSLSDTATVTYAEKLEQLFRMGPDIVGVAECVDAETAKSICEAAGTGKLVYVIIEADSALQALGRWLKLVGDRKTAVEHLVGLSNQRLLRKLCPECKQGYAPNQDILKKFNLPADKAKVLYRPGKVVFDKRGKESTCADCYGTGFIGRTGVYETITLNSELSRVILTCQTLQDMGVQFRRAKMVFLQEQALRKVLAGETAINEMARVLTPAKQAKAKQTK